MSADSIQSQVDSHPDGTTFCFSSGTYVLNHYVALKQANQFICTQRRTCVLTGLDQYRGALTAQYGTSGHLIKGFVVEHFIATSEWPIAGLQLRDNGVMEDNETRYNQTGIEINSNQTVRGNFIHHNRQYGISGGPGTNMLLESNELAWNNTGGYDPNNDAGGSKIVGASQGSSYVTWRKNYIHDNYGRGIWSDSNVHHALYEENIIENNQDIGIFHEVSWDAVIRNNTLRNNNITQQGKGFSCWHGAQLHLNNSQGVQIYGNTIEGVDGNPLCLANTTRDPGGPMYPTALADVTVSGNVFKMRGTSQIGLVGDTMPSNVSFSGNTYYVDDLSRTDWNYMGEMTRTQWQGAGQDTNGKFLTW